MLTRGSQRLRKKHICRPTAITAHGGGSGGIFLYCEHNTDCCDPQQPTETVLEVTLSAQREKM